MTGVEHCHGLKRQRLGAADPAPGATLRTDASESSSSCPDNVKSVGAAVPKEKKKSRFWRYEVVTKDDSLVADTNADGQTSAASTGKGKVTRATKRK
jgi:hypothetical protein